MAVGIISSPASWIQGTIIAPTWLQNVQDNSNDYIGVKAGTISVAAVLVDGVGGNVTTVGQGTSRSHWIAGAGIQIGSSNATYTNHQYWTTGAAGQILCAPIYLPYKNATFAATITAVSVRVNCASTTGSSLDLFKVTNMSTTSAPVFASVGNGSSSSTGEQTITASGLSETMTSDKAYYVQYQSTSSAGDKIYGFNITYTLSVF